MSAVKDQIVTMIQNLPDDATLEDIQYHLYVLSKIQAGLISADTEPTVSHEEAKRILRQRSQGPSSAF